MRALLALIVALAATGCYHDKYDVNGPVREEYHLPPNEERYNRPDTATYRQKTPEKQPDTLTNKGRGGAGGPGGF